MKSKPTTYQTRTKKVKACRITLSHDLFLILFDQWQSIYNCLICLSNKNPALLLNCYILNIHTNLRLGDQIQKIFKHLTLPSSLRTQIEAVLIKVCIQLPTSRAESSKALSFPIKFYSFVIWQQQKFCETHWCLAQSWILLEFTFHLSIHGYQSNRYALKGSNKVP